MICTNLIWACTPIPKTEDELRNIDAEIFTYRQRRKDIATDVDAACRLWQELVPCIGINPERIEIACRFRISSLISVEQDKRNFKHCWCRSRIVSRLTFFVVFRETAEWLMLTKKLINPGLRLSSERNRPLPNEVSYICYWQLHRYIYLITLRDQKASSQALLMPDRS